MRAIRPFVLILLAAASLARAQVAVETWGPGERCTHRKTLTIRHAEDQPVPAAITVDLSALPKGAKILHASLHAAREPVPGTSDEALVDAVVSASPGRFGVVQPPQKPLALEAPWYRSFDATELVRKWAGDPKANYGLHVKSFPGWRPELTYLEVVYKGASRSAPRQVEGLKVLHRAGQTFITFNENEPLAKKEKVTWGELKELLGGMDAERRVRYRVYRHAQAITGATIAAAELLGEVGPLSAYNVNGRSVDELIAIVRRRAIDDLDLSKQLAHRRTNYFSRYNPDMPQMSDVVIGRLAITDGSPLPLGTGLYVHHPAEAGRAYYAVVASVDGTANCKDFSAANSLAEPVAEEPGAGEPVLQGTADVTVFYDYPGQRLRYVQWAAPPLASLPNSYFNLGVFVPRGYERAAPRRLGLFFHDGRQRYLRPPWPHRQDTVLISPHDYPYRSYGYGHHEALGTLRSFKAGTVRPFFVRRADALLKWAVAKFTPDTGRLSVGGSGYWGGTAALQYGMRRPGLIAYVMADGSPDPDPKQTPDRYVVYPWRKDRPVGTPRPGIDAVWGQPDFDCKAESGKSIWEEMDLPAYVRASKEPLPFLSLGAGAMAVTWKQETDLMKAMMESRNGFMSEFFWGGSGHMHLPVTADSGDLPFEPRSDAPLLACRPTQFGLDKSFDEKHWVTGDRGYGGGGRACTRPRWRSDDIIDAPDRLEMTIFTSRSVVYAGSVTLPTTVRNARKFKPAAGGKLAWSVTDPAGGKQLQGGEVTVGENGAIVIPNLTFAAPGRLIIKRSQAQ